MNEAILLHLLTAAIGTKRTWPGLCLFVRFRREADMHDERLTGTMKICYRSKTSFAGNERDVGTLLLKTVLASTLLRASTLLPRAQC
jgi:hypothetical protein